MGKPVIWAEYHVDYSSPTGLFPDSGATVAGVMKPQLLNEGTRVSVATDARSLAQDPNTALNLALLASYGCPIGIHCHSQTDIEAVVVALAKAGLPRELGYISSFLTGEARWVVSEMLARDGRCYCAGLSEEPLHGAGADDVRSGVNRLAYMTSNPYAHDPGGWAIHVGAATGVAGGTAALSAWLAMVLAAPASEIHTLRLHVRPSTSTPLAGLTWAQYNTWRTSTGIPAGLLEMTLPQVARYWAQQGGVPSKRYVS